MASLTWIKSLSAPLSHEFIQFVLECPESRAKYRIVAERDAYGDSVYATARSADSPMANFLVAHEECKDGICHLRPSDEQHDLPLPLLSLSWKHLPVSARPTALDIGQILNAISQRYPKYNILRQHCWWFAEAVFEAILGLQSSLMAGKTTAGQYSAPRVKEWPWSLYRYSYVVVGKKVWKRQVLLEAAREFRKGMNEGSTLIW